jgi:uncharacterized protein YrrD
MSHVHDTAMTGHPVVDEQGEKIGVIDDVVFDVQSNEPRWAFVKRGLLHPRPAVVPLQWGSYRATDGSIVVPFDKQLVVSAPKVAREHVLTSEDERALLAHYGV